MKTKLLASSVVAIIYFNGCVVSVDNIQQKETYNSKIIKSIVMDENISVTGNTSFLNKKSNNNDSPLLSKPKIAKIKVNGYIDSDGDYHDTEVLHLKIEESKFLENKKYFSINVKE